MGNTEIRFPTMWQHEPFDEYIKRVEADVRVKGDLRCQVGTKLFQFSKEFLAEYATRKLRFLQQCNKLPQQPRFNFGCEPCPNCNSYHRIDRHLVTFHFPPGFPFLKISVES